MSRKVLVIGGATGIGAATVEQLCADGFEVTFTYNRSAAEAEALSAGVYQRLGYEPARLHCPLDNLDATEATFEQYLHDHAAPYGLVHVAGSAHDQLAALVSLSSAEEVFRINFFSLVLAVKMFWRPMISQREGRIVAISSTAAASGRRGNAIYSATKGAIESYLRCLADETRDRGITVNWVRPGMVETRMMPVNSANEQYARKRIPFGRMGHPDEIASVIAFLLSDRAGYIHGTGLTIDGGMTSVFG